VPATLTSLRIRNLALVEDLLWEPGPGFTAVTSETGAGKSIILGALAIEINHRLQQTSSTLRSDLEISKTPTREDLRSVTTLR